MYLAPLNYDRYFRKVFSDTAIVNRLAAAELDFRCRIGEMKWIGTETLKDDNYTYIDDYEKFIERVRRYDKDIFDEGMEIGREQKI